MAGSKNASKVSSKAVASGGQQSLLHFYKKKPKPADDITAAVEIPIARASGMDPSKAPDNNTLPQTDGMASPALPIEPETKQGQPSDESISSVATATNPPQAPRAPTTSNSPFVQEEPMEDCLNGDVLREHPQQRPSDLGSNYLRESVIVDRPKSPSGAQQIEAPAKPPPRETFPIFRSRLPPPKSPQPSGGKGKRPPNQQASSSKSIPLETKRKSNQGHARVDLHDVVDLTTPSPNDKPVKFTHTNRGGSVVIIEDEPVPRGSQDAPIDLRSSPPPPNTKPTKVIHPFFARRAAKQKEGDHFTTSPVSMSTALHTQIPWPNGEMQHSRGPQSCFWTSGFSPFPQYRGSRPPPWFSSQPSIKFLQNESATRHIFPERRTCTPTSHVPTSLERDEIISGIPSSHREHSAISRLLSTEPPRTAENGEAWTHKWRPRSAAEVLGNEDNSRYMKKWLQALEIRAGETLSERAVKGKSAGQALFGVRGTKRPNVVRAVEKKRGRKKRRVESSDDESSLGGWIVPEDEEEEEYFASEGPSEDLLPHDDFSFGEGGPASPSEKRCADKTENAKPPSSTPEYFPAEFAQLTNTILLAGPSGSGKTSSVYACAEELGWEVFEVYPGIGRRSGANISSLVGDVGKNHIVGRRGVSGSSAKNASIERSLMKSGFGFLADETETGHEDRSRAVRQSIILFEEVDILFKEDANFWPAVVNVIKSSHRPVFITCNDISLVPRDDLPVQATLYFQACPAPLAISFLQSVCLAEGKAVPRHQLEDLYSATYELISPDEPDEPQVAYPSQPQPCSDLRRVLNELQFWCQREHNTDMEAVIETSLMTADSPPEVLADWSRSTGSLPEKETLQGCGIFRMWEHSDCASYVDGYLGRRPSDILEALAIDRHGPSPDDEIGHALLEKARVDDNSTGLPFYNGDEAIARETLITARHVFETSGAGPHVRGTLLGNERGATLESRSLLRDRAANQMRVVSYLDDVIPLSAPLLPRPPAVLEYAAYMRQMVSADDAAAREGRVREMEMRGRWRIGVHRYLTLSEAGVEGARATQLGDAAGETLSGAS